MEPKASFTRGYMRFCFSAFPNKPKFEHPFFKVVGIGTLFDFID